ncbi:MAG: hypothetical protein AAF517_02375 [Planctomycetota bacterium]
MLSTIYKQEVESYQRIAECAGVPFIDLRDYRISPGILQKLPRSFVNDHRCVPMVFNRTRVILVCADPADAYLIEAEMEQPRFEREIDLDHLVWSEAGIREVEFVMTTPTALEETLSRLNELPLR